MIGVARLPEIRKGGEGGHTKLANKEQASEFRFGSGRVDRGDDSINNVDGAVDRGNDGVTVISDIVNVASTRAAADSDR